MAGRAAARGQGGEGEGGRSTTSTAHDGPSADFFPHEAKRARRDKPAPTAPASALAPASIEVKVPNATPGGLSPGEEGGAHRLRRQLAEEKTTTGLSNLGNTCYMNASLQVLSHCTPLALFFGDCPGHLELAQQAGQRDQAEATSLPISCHLATLLARLWSGRHYTVSPERFRAAVVRRNPLFRGIGQHDSQEFLRFVLDALHEELQLPTAYRSAEKHSIVSDLFQGELLSRVECGSCSEVSKKTDTFMDVSIELVSAPPSSAEGVQPRASEAGATSDFGTGSWLTASLRGLTSFISSPITGLFGETHEAVPRLEDCLSAFCGSEVIDGENLYKCDACKGRHPARKSLSFKTLPEVLCLHLKRFKYDTYYPSKLQRHVDFPLSGLDLGPYCSAAAETAETTYDLFAAICHLGVAGAGHYVAYAEHPVTGTWHEYDDSAVSEVSPEYVLQRQAYILCYRRRDTVVRERTREVRRLLQSLQSTAGDGGDAFEVYLSRQWSVLASTTANPGPISNSDFGCPHGGVLPHRAALAEDLSVAVPLNLYDYYYKRFGGGPMVTALRPCKACKADLRRLQARRREEWSTIEKMDSLNPDGEEEDFYAIGMLWVKRWRRFVESQDPDVGPPDKIDSWELLGDDKLPRATIHLNKHYFCISRPMWDYLLGCYGGGPEIICAEPDIATAKQIEGRPVRMPLSAQRAAGQRLRTMSTEELPSSDSDSDL